MLFFHKTAFVVSVVLAGLVFAFSANLSLSLLVIVASGLWLRDSKYMQTKWLLYVWRKTKNPFELLWILVRLGLPAFAFREFAVSAALSTPLPDGKFLCEFVSEPAKDLLQQYCFRRPYMFHSMTVAEVEKLRAEVARLESSAVKYTEPGMKALALRSQLQTIMKPTEAAWHVGRARIMARILGSSDIVRDFIVGPGERFVAPLPRVAPNVPDGTMWWATRAVWEALAGPEEHGHPERSASWYGIREDSLVGFEASRRALGEVDSFISIYCDRNHISEREEKARRSAALAHCEILRKMFGAADWSRKQKVPGASVDPFKGGFEAVKPPVDSWKKRVEWA
jgi:hypothetical protein